MRDDARDASAGRVEIWRLRAALAFWRLSCAMSRFVSKIPSWASCASLRAMLASRWRSYSQSSAPNPDMVRC